MAVGAFKIIGQDGQIAAALPFAMGISTAQTALAAGAETTVNVPFTRSMSTDGTQTDFLIVGTILVNNEANVMYAVQVQPVNSVQIGSIIATKIRNVGSVAGTVTWRVALLAIPVGVA